MVRLCVMIPALNEEQDLPRVLKDIPRVICGVDDVVVLVVDDGSIDQTRAVALQYGADLVVSSRNRRGLASTFQKGLGTALSLGADVIVNIDADYQYLPSEIPKLIEPILRGQADIVIGDRQTDKVKEFSRSKRFFQRLGSSTVQHLAGIDERIDAVSGFRAFSVEAALRLNIVTKFSYTTEMIIQASEKGLDIVSVPITRNHTPRKSRLFQGSWEHIRKTGSTIARVYLMYRPLKVLSLVSLALGAIGFLLLFRLLLLEVFTGSGFAGHVQSLTFGLALCGMALLVLVLGVLADLIAVNRRLMEDALERVKRLEVEMHSTCSSQCNGDGGIISARQRSQAAVEMVESCSSTHRDLG